MISLFGPALAAGFVITVVEMTEVVALVFALTADQRGIAHGAAGALLGILVVAAIAFTFGAVLTALPKSELLGAAAVTLAGFGIFLFPSTLRSYRWAVHGSGLPAGPSRSIVPFAGGFAVGAVESTEVVVVLLALTAAGYGPSALLGAIAAGAVLAVATLAVHQQIRRIKVPWLKWGATSMLFAFAVFWGGEALGGSWPGGELFLLPLFLVALLAVRLAIAAGLRGAVRGPGAGPAP